MMAKKKPTVLHSHFGHRGSLYRPYAHVFNCPPTRSRNDPEIQVRTGSNQPLMKQHFSKENDVLFPMGLRALSPADATDLVAGFVSCEDALGVDTRHRFHTLAERLAEQSKVEDLSASLDKQVLASILSSLPVELSFVDAEDTVRHFSHENKDKIFARSRSAIGMNVENCHPKKSAHKVKEILADFRAGKRDSAEFWVDFADKNVHIRYFTVRDNQGAYLGCLEVVQDIKPIQALTGQRRLLDSVQ